MSSATERAAARKAAILGRRSDRLAKLTSSARGEDAPAYMHDDPPLAPLPRPSNFEQFVGEESMLPTPPSAPTPSTGSASPFAPFGMPLPPTDPSVWSEEQQARLLNALMAGAAQQHQHPPRSSSSSPQPPLLEGPGNLPFPEGDPLAALMSMMGQQGQGEKGAFGGPPGTFPPNLFAAPPSLAPAKRTLLQKLMPLVHLIAGWLLLAYFVLWREQQAYDAKPHAPGSLASKWTRWAELGWQSPSEGWGVQFVPFFWAFTTLTIVLHSWRIFKGLDPVQPHMLVSLALPHLPRPLPSVILNGMKYWQIGGVFLDDVAALLFGIAFIIWLSSWLVN